MTNEEIIKQLADIREKQQRVDATAAKFHAARAAIEGTERAWWEARNELDNAWSSLRAAIENRKPKDEAGSQHAKISGEALMQ